VHDDQQKVVTVIRRARDLWAPLVIYIAPAMASCASDDRRLQQTARALSSLTSTTQMVCLAWMSGDASTAYTVTTLDRTLQLTEAQRNELMRSSGTRTDPLGAQLTRIAEDLERSLGTLIHAVQANDGTSVRREIARLPAASTHGP
jgi:hypothetical protein